MTPPRMMSVHRMRWIVAAMRVQVALLPPRLLLRAFNPAQPRVPAGNPEGGRWTDADGGGSSPGRDDGLFVRVSDEGDRRYSVVLAEEEARVGHTLRGHVGKTEEELLRLWNSVDSDIYFPTAKDLRAMLTGARDRLG